MDKLTKSQSSQPWTQTDYFVNYSIDEKGGILNNQWARSRDKLFLIKLSIVNDTPYPLLHLMLVHSNLQNNTHLQRAFYQQLFSKQRIIKDWPVFRPTASSSPHQHFQVQFCIDEKDVKEQYSNINGLEWIIQEEIDKQIEIRISYDMDTRKFEVQLYESLNPGYNYILWKKQGHRIELQKEEQVEQKGQETIDKEEEKEEIQTAKMSIKPIMKKCQAQQLIPKNDDFKKQMLKMIDDRNEQMKEKLIRIFGSKEQPPFFNEYSFLASYILQDLQIYEQNPYLIQSHKSSYQSQLQNLPGQNPFTTVDEVRKFLEITAQKNEKEKGKPNKDNYQFLKCLLSCFKKLKKEERKKEIYYHQSKHLDNCYFISTMDQIITKAEFILDKIWIFQDKIKGKAVAILNVDGKMSPITENFNLAKEDSRQILKYSHFTNQEHLEHMADEKMYKNIERCILLEKCLASIYGGYEKLNEGLPSEVLMIVTNHSTQTYPLYNRKEPDKTLHQDKQRQYFFIMVTWSIERDRIVNGYKEKKAGSLKKYKEDHLSTSIAFEHPTYQPKYTLIVIFNLKEEPLSLMFPNLEKEDLKALIHHSYSFQGIYTYDLQEPFDHKKEYFIKLRDLRDGDTAQNLRDLWYAKNKHRLKITSEIKDGKTSYLVKTNSGHFYIQYSVNEFILTMEELLSMSAWMQVCTYIPDNLFSSIPALMKKQESSNFNIKIQAQSLCWVNLHQQNPRRSFKQNEQIKIENLMYNKTRFELEIVDQFKIPFRSNFQYTCGGFDFHLLPKNIRGYSLRASMQQQKLSELCFLSILSKSRRNSLEYDYNNHNISSISYSQKRENTLSLHQKKYEQNFIFEIEHVPKEAHIYCKLSGNLKINHDLEDVNGMIKITSHRISDLTLKNIENVPLIDQFTFYPLAKQNIEPRLKIPFSRPQQKEEIYGVFKSKKMLNSFSQQVDGSYVLRIAFQGHLLRKKQSDWRVFFDYSVEMRQIDSIFFGDLQELQESMFEPKQQSISLASMSTSNV